MRAPSRSDAPYTCPCAAAAGQSRREDRTPVAPAAVAIEAGAAAQLGQPTTKVSSSRPRRSQIGHQRSEGTIMGGSSTS